MKILMTTVDPWTNKEVKKVVVSNGPIYIDLNPSDKDRMGPGEGNGFMGPECLVQVETGANRSHLVGIKIISELGRDDSKYIEMLDFEEIRKV
jgi:hypothetical protein